MRIDTLNEIDGVQFKDAVQNRQHFKHGKLEIYFIGRDDFIKNKEAAGRKKDLQDAKRLMPKLSKGKTIKTKPVRKKGQ